jgi:glycosyltransferase involved in cell wall biosynthesis
MRIAYITSRYPTVSHTFVLREVQALRRSGVDVRTVSVKRVAPSELLSQVAQDEDASTWAIRPVSGLRLVWDHLIAAASAPRAYAGTLRLAVSSRKGLGRDRAWAFAYFAQAIRLWCWARRNDVEHLHGHFANVGSDVSMFAAEFGRRSGKGPASWSFTMHGPAEFFEVRAHRLADKTRAAAFVACISDFCRSQLMGLVEEDHWDKLIVVHCGVDLDEYLPPQRSSWPKAAALEILCIGRLASVKGHVLLVDALAELHAAGYAQARLTLVGDGPRRSAILQHVRRRGLEAHVTYLGALGQDEVRELFTTADVFCLPSFAEGVPVVLMEAMASEVPVIASKIMGIPELVTDGEDGLLLAPGRTDLITQALVRLIEDPELAARIGAAGRQTIAEGFTSQEAAARLVAAFTRTIAARTSAEHG